MPHLKGGNQTVPTRGMTDVDCKLTVLVAACTLCGFCLFPLVPPLCLSPYSLCRLHGCHIPLVLERSSAACCLQDLRELRDIQLPPPLPCFVATMPLAASSPALPPASGGSNGSRPRCTGMCLSPVVSSLLSSSQLLQVDLFSTRHTERGPVLLQDSSRDQFTIFTVKRNDK